MEKDKQLSEDFGLSALKMSPKDQTNKPPATEPSEPEIVEAIEGIDDGLEIASVNNNLDSILEHMQHMEQRTDDIKAQLMALLMSNREILNELKEENAKHKDENDGGDQL